MNGRYITVEVLRGTYLPTYEIIMGKGRDGVWRQFIGVQHQENYIEEAFDPHGFVTTKFHLGLEEVSPERFIAMVKKGKS